MKSILNVEVSCFRNYNSPDNPRTVNLLDWLRSSKHYEKQRSIMASENKSERDLLKATLPAITPSGTFSRRTVESLLDHSGLIQFDIDKKGNEHIENYDELKFQISHIPNVAYCGRSVSGTGYWGLIPIEAPDNHLSYFEYCDKAFKKFGITLDPAPKSVASLRGYSYDPDAYFNHDAILLNKYELPERKDHLQLTMKPKINSEDVIEIAVNMILKAVDGEKHFILLKAAKLIGGYIASGEIKEDEAVLSLENAIQSRNIENFDAAKRTIAKGIQYGKNSPIELSSKISSFELLSISQIKRADNEKTIKIDEGIFPEIDISEERFRPANSKKNIEPDKLIELVGDSNSFQSFSGISGKFYVLNPVNKTSYAVYNSIFDYNLRNGLPT